MVICGDHWLIWLAVKCKNDDCDNTDIVYTQAQIRSADEPMTTFYKVKRSLVIVTHGANTNGYVVPGLQD